MVVKNIGGLGGLGGMPAKTPEQPSGFSNFVQSPDFGNVLQSIGMSLMSSPSNAPLSSMPTILSGVQAQSMRQRQEQLAAEERQAQTEKANATRTWLESNQPDLVPIFDMDPGAAINALVERKKPKPQAGPMEINGQLVDPVTGAVLGDYRDPNSGQGAAPSGYEWNGDGTLAFIPGGPQDPAIREASKPPTEAELRAAGLNTVVSGDAQLLLGDGSAQNPGIYDQLANGGDQAWNAGAFGINPMSWASSPEYRQAKDAVASIAQSYLYSTSGASAPEGEAARIAESVTPKPFDSPEQLQNKRDRLQRMVLSIQQKQGNAAPTGAQTQPAGDLSTVSDDDLLRQLGM